MIIYSSPCHILPLLRIRYRKRLMLSQSFISAIPQPQPSTFGHDVASSRMEGYGNSRGDCSVSSSRSYRLDWTDVKEHQFDKTRHSVTARTHPELIIQCCSEWLPRTASNLEYDSPNSDSSNRIVAFVVCSPNKLIGLCGRIPSVHQRI